MLALKVRYATSPDVTETVHLYLGLQVKFFRLVAIPSSLVFLIDILLKVSALPWNSNYEECDAPPDELSVSSLVGNKPESIPESSASLGLLLQGSTMVLSVNITKFSIILLPTNVLKYNHADVMCLDIGEFAISCRSGQFDEALEVKTYSVSFGLCNVLYESASSGALEVRYPPFKPLLAVAGANVMYRAHSRLEPTSPNQCVVQVHISIRMGKISANLSSSTVGSVGQIGESIKTCYKEITFKLFVATESNRKKSLARRDSPWASQLQDDSLRWPCIIDDRSYDGAPLGHGISVATKSKPNEFSYSDQLSGIVYFDDLREYASPDEVFRITGTLGNGGCFPPPPLWRNGSGIGLFWELYEKECGCQKLSLNSQDPAQVQRKLVRILSNYEFARFAWRSLVAPELRSSPSAVTASDWVLDEHTRTVIRSDVTVRVGNHVNMFSNQIGRKRIPNLLFSYRACCEAIVEQLTFEVGNALRYAE